MTACQTPTKPSPKDGPDLVSAAVAEAKVEWCRGQTPAEFLPDQYNAAPEWVKTYISGNNDQWLKTCGGNG
jgi:hypothetical protein